MDETEVNLDNALKEQIAKQFGSLSVVDQEKFMSQYSFAALVYGPIYFFAMNDWFFAILSLTGSILFFPIIFLLPIFARRRAWANKKWFNLNDFIRLQKVWDKAGIYGAVLLLVVFYCSFLFFTKYLAGILPGGGSLRDIIDFKNTVEQLNGF